MKSTKDLTNELMNREGVTHLEIEPYEKVSIITDHATKEFTGPAIILVNQD